MNRPIRADPQASEPNHTFGADLTATAALALYSAAVAAGMARVFGGWGFLDNMLLLVLVGHGAGLVLRRLHVPGWISAPLMLVLLAWTIGVMHYRFTYSLLLPTSDTLDLFRSELGLVQEQFRSAVAPVLYGGGWDVLAAIGMAAAVLLADLFAFRAFARAEALVPGGVLFVFIAALGTDRLRVTLTVLLVAAGVIATVVLRSYHAPGPLAASRGRGPIRLALPAAMGTALVVALLAGAIGPRLPGASAEPVYDTRGRGGGSVTEIVSPLVDIRSRLTNRSNSELFVVQATAASYWRSSALPQFDGTTWDLPERSGVSTAGSGLSTARTGTEELRQRIRIVNLGGRRVIKKADPTNVSPNEKLRWSADTSTLVKIDAELTNGDVFDIVSASPRFDPATLAAATSTDPGDPIYFELPDNWPDPVAQTAREVTNGSDSPYEAALALQNWFRDPDQWSYSLDVQSGHGTNAIEAFLRERIGYCEQFAGTYAAMMRSLGYASRVSVGFTSGTSVGGGTYSVLGKNAHAWPEVWFDGLGWVAFEPTPGRGSPGAENYTQVTPDQDDSGIDPNAPREQADDTVVPSTVPSTGESEDNPLNIPQEDLLDDGSSAAEVVDPEPAGGGSNWAIALIFLALAGAVATPAIVRRWRRSRPQSTEVRLANLWQRAMDSVSDVGVEPDATRTPIEMASETAERFPVAARPISSLAEVLTNAAYGPTGTDGFESAGPYGASTIRSCSHWCTQIDRAVRDSLDLPTRVRRYFTRWR